MKKLTNKGINNVAGGGMQMQYDYSPGSKSLIKVFVTDDKTGRTVSDKAYSLGTLNEARLADRRSNPRTAGAGNYMVEPSGRRVHVDNLNPIYYDL